MTTKLQFSHQITERRKSKTVNQEMIVSVTYDSSEDAFDDIEVHIYQDGKHLCEISKLLDKAEGDPLSQIIEAIDWREIYKSRNEEEPSFEDWVTNP